MIYLFPDLYHANLSGLRFNNSIPLGFTGTHQGALWRTEDFVKRSPSLLLYFGANALQDDNHLYIKKSDLQNINNNGESLLVGIIHRLLNILDKNIDSISTNLFDMYFSGKRITYVIIVSIDKRMNTNEIDLSEIDLEINPNNYG